MAGPARAVGGLDGDRGPGQAAARDPRPGRCGGHDPAGLVASASSHGARWGGTGGSRSGDGGRARRHDPRGRVDRPPPGLGAQDRSADPDRHDGRRGTRHGVRPVCAVRALAGRVPRWRPPVGARPADLQHRRWLPLRQRQRLQPVGAGRVERGRDRQERRLDLRLGHHEPGPWRAGLRNGVPARARSRRWSSARPCS